jgi:hypothetical protein
MGVLGHPEGCTDRATAKQAAPAQGDLVTARAQTDAARLETAELRARSSWRITAAPRAIRRRDGTTFEERAASKSWQQANAAGGGCCGASKTASEPWFSMSWPAAGSAAITR